MKRILIPIAMIVSMVGLMVGPASASTNALTVIYKSTVTPLPGNLPSDERDRYANEAMKRPRTEMRSLNCVAALTASSG